MNRILAIAGICALLASSALPAAASLGSPAASVEEDRAALQGQSQTTQGEAYTMHQIQVPTGTTVKEYVTPGGQVFAVTWQGPFHPDLHQVLGSYYDQYMKLAAAQRANRHGHGPLIIETPGLVVEIAGHMRSFRGCAYVPQMMPANVHAEDLQ